MTDVIIPIMQVAPGTSPGESDEESGVLLPELFWHYANWIEYRMTQGYPPVETLQILHNAMLTEHKRSLRQNAQDERSSP